MYVENVNYMKYIFYWGFICALLLSVVSCSDEQEFFVKGSVENASGKTLYLENVGISSVIMLDSVKLKGDGKFSFKKERPAAPDFYRLRLDNQWINFAVDSTEHIVIHAREDSAFIRSYTIEGSENSLNIKELTLMQLQASEAYNKLLKEKSERGMPEDTFIVKVREIVAVYKEGAKRYIYENTHSTAAYFALFQQINNMLIFSPYDKDDNKLYAAVATGWDFYYADSPRARQLHELTLQGLKVIRGHEHKNPALDNIQVRDVFSYFEISLPDVNGTIRNLSDVVKEGKLIVLDFTAYQSKISPMHNMNLGSLYEKYQSKGLEIFQVSLDEDLHFWQNVSSRLPWICVRDPETVYSSVAASHNVRDLPTTFIINRKGEIMKRLDNDKELDVEIKKML